MRHAVAFSDKVVPFGKGVVRMNITQMPENHVIHYNEKFRVDCAKLYEGDFSDLIDELVGKRFIEECEDGYRVEQVVLWHGYWNVIRNGERAPCYRLFLSLSQDHTPLIL